MPAGSTVLTRRYWIVPSGLRSSSWFSSQSAWSGRRRRSRRVTREAGGRRRRGWPSWNLQSAVANASAFSVFVPVGVALDQLGERVALELGAQVHARRAGEVVEPVAVLQVLQLRLEDVVEGRAEQAAEQVGDLGETADPQVDVVEAGVRSRRRPSFAQAPVLNMKSAASAGGTSRRRAGRRSPARRPACPASVVCAR